MIPVNPVWNKFRLFIACLLFLGASGVEANGQEERDGKLTLAPYSFRTFDGREVPAELGKLWVRENRTGNSGRLIQLAFVRLKSTAAQPAAPIVWLAGGPGTPGIVMGRIPPYFNLFNRLRDVADVILLDQRGAGMSSPNLKCQAAAVPLDVFETADKWLRTYTQMSGSCAESWRKQNVDLAAYTTNANADDVDELRKALGAKQISLIGHSYGTVLAQDVIRRHGHNVQRVVFASSDGPDTLLASPTAWDLLIKKLSYFASNDARVGKIVPDMELLYKRVLDKLERNPVSLSVTDERTRKPVSIRVGKIGLQWLMRLAANDARTYAGLPALLYTIDQGDYSILTRQIEPLYNGFQGRSPMANAINCSDGWSAERLASVRLEAPKAMSGTVNLQWTPEVCKAVGITNINVRSQTRIFSNVPALFLSGTLDTNTPPFQAEEVRWGFPNSAHIVIENGGHETLPAAEVQTIIVDFFKGENVQGRVVSFERPRFLSVEEAKSPVTNRR